ncbi:hypothetical protein [Pasteurella multocida]|uniref:hypothetical protein n=1 Tax=Pasteurella multocida TaxID=747 RepID=UPI000999F08C|nr:hypothetical protein [Pasteurella multocida]MBE7394388.1 hypothetical protein [Pasteurella multocida]MCL7768401.1 hypothetical protein [Pasteurella multocida]MCL7770808.1 hypothetical protein [Pasteurella multocida]OPD05339.1 hypothetical protein BTV57_04860 [Pasteurella multocida subsp. septica]UZT19490.1 hypothetical protein ORI84_04870 [Pasteurella multocida]
MQTATIKVNLKKANELMFYFKDTHDLYLMLAKRATTITERIQQAKKASECRQYYKKVSDFTRASTKKIH